MPHAYVTDLRLQLVGECVRKGQPNFEAKRKDQKSALQKLFTMHMLPRDHMRRASGESSYVSDFAAMLCHCAGASTQDAVVPTKQKPTCISSRVSALLLLLRCQNCNLAVFLNHSVCGAIKQQCTSAYQPGIALVDSRSN